MPESQQPRRTAPSTVPPSTVDHLLSIARDNATIIADSLCDGDQIIDALTFAFLKGCQHFATPQYLPEIERAKATILDGEASGQ